MKVEDVEKWMPVSPKWAQTYKSHDSPMGVTNIVVDLEGSFRAWNWKEYSESPISGLGMGVLKTKTQDLEN